MVRPVEDDANLAHRRQVLRVHMVQTEDRDAKIAGRVVGAGRR